MMQAGVLLERFREFATSGKAYAPIVFLLLCLTGLFRDNVVSNEVTKFSDAMYYADPSWIPGFLPQGPDFGRRQWLFQTLITPILNGSGFLAVSLMGRFVCFLMFAYAFALIARSLRLKLVFLLLVVMLFDYYPFLVAGEWTINTFEPKMISYALILIALGYLLDQRRSLAVLAALLGVATSFHVLVGLYATFAIGGVVALQWRKVGGDAASAIKALLVFLLTSAFAIRPIVGHLFVSGRDAPIGSALLPSYIYVFLRSPHHLDPSSWPSYWPVCLGVFLIVLFVCCFIVNRSAAHAGESEAQFAVQSLFLFTLLSMVPFIVGLFVSLFDTQGRLLQYYLFRFGDAMLPMCTYLFFALALQRIPYRNVALGVVVVGWLVVAGIVGLRGVQLEEQVQLVRQFPGPAQKLTPKWKENCEWIKTNTPADALFIVPPGRSESITFPWLTRRRMLATLKQVNLNGGLVEWHRRLSDLAWTDKPWPERGFRVTRWLKKRYESLSTEQVQNLMDKYEASYFVTRASHSLDLPEVFNNKKYSIYVSPRKLP